MSRPRIEAYTLSEAAKAAGVSTKTIERYIQGGRILANRVGIKWEIPKREIDRLKDNRARQKKKLLEKKEPKIRRPRAFRKEIKAALIQSLTESTSTLTDKEKLKREIDDLTEEQAAGIAAAFSGFIGEISSKFENLIDQAKTEEEARAIEAGFIAALEKIDLEGEE